MRWSVRNAWFERLVAAKEISCLWWNRPALARRNRVGSEMALATVGVELVSKAKARVLNPHYGTTEAVPFHRVLQVFFLHLSLAAVLLLTLPVAAQLQVGDNVSLNLNGIVSVGYTDINGSDIASSHSLSLGGNGTLSGYYYDPNFVNFSLAPYYNQSSQNSESRSIFDSSGFEFDSGIFGGSHFPGSVSFSKSWDSQGNFGIPGVPDYTTRGNGQGFSIGWGAFVQGLPSLSVNFNTGSSAYSVLGADQNGSNDYKNFNVRSNYTIAGFNLNAGYNIGNSNSEIPLIFENDTLESVTSDTNSWFVGASHALPMHGSASASFSRNYLDSNYLGYSFNGTIDTLNAFAGITPTQKLGLSVAMGYTDNLAGAFYQTIIPGSGSLSQITNQAQAQASGTAGAQPTGSLLQQTEQSSNAFYISAFGAYALARNLQLNFEAQRREQTYLGKSYGANTYGAGAVYTRGLLGGSMNAAVNFADNTTDYESGNALSFTTNLGYSRSFAGWGVSGDFSYAQNAQTYLLTYMNSFYNYSANVRHRFGRVVWTASAAGSHSVLTNEVGTGNGGESYSTSLGARRLTLSASYAKLNGYGILSWKRNYSTAQPAAGSDPAGVAAALWRLQLFVYLGDFPNPSPDSGGQFFPCRQQHRQRFDLLCQSQRADVCQWKLLVPEAHLHRRIRTAGAGI